MSLVLEFPGAEQPDKADIRFSVWSDGYNYSPEKYEALAVYQMNNGVLPPSTEAYPLPPANTLHPLTDDLQFRIHVPFSGDEPLWNESALEFGLRDPGASPATRSDLLRTIPDLLESAGLLEPQDQEHLRTQVNKRYPAPDREVGGMTREPK